MDRHPRRPRTAIVALVLSLLAVACGSADRGSEVRGGAALEAPSAASALVGGEAYVQLAAGLLRATPADRNVVVSPWIVGEGLGMLHLGAEGDTASAIESALGIDADEVAPALGSVGELLSRRSGQRSDERRQGQIAVRASNDLWLQRGTTLEQPFLTGLARWYDRGVQVADVRSDPDGVREAVNDRLSQETGGAVVGLVPPDVITAETRLLLTGGLWFQAPWERELDTADTSDEPFTRADGTRVGVPVMTVEGADVGYASGDGWQAAAIPYLGDELAMVVIVPDAGSEALVGDDLEPGLLREALDGLVPSEVSLRLPRFAFTSREPLDATLAALGLGVLSDLDQAELGGVTTDERLAVSHLLHQATISVDEDGTSASAATVQAEPVPPLRQPRDVQATRPFVFLVVDRQTGAPVLAGRVADPSAPSA